MERTDVAIIGAGPAGLSAAVQLIKEGVKFKVFERDSPGGLIRYANRVDNLLGHGGKTGRDLAGQMVEHALGMGVRPTLEAVISVEWNDGQFIVRTDRSSCCSEYLILATGSVPRKIDLEDVVYKLEDEYILPGDDLLILGGGDLALDNALRAADHGANVTILYRSYLKANKGLVEEVMNSGIRTIMGDQEDLRKDPDGSFVLKDELKFNKVAVFIGRSPERYLIDGVEVLGPVDKSFSTSVKGLYLIGDAASVDHSQSAFAMSSGLSCAMDIARRMRSDESGP